MARGRPVWVFVVVGVAVGAMLSLTGLAGPRNPVQHVVCSTGASVADEPSRVIAAVLVNSPYGGRAFGWGIDHDDYSQDLWLGWGTGAANGTSEAVLLGIVDSSLDSVHNSTVWGPGIDRPCETPYTVKMASVNLYAEYGASIAEESNLSDVGEANNASLFGQFTNLSATVFLDNSFTQQNSPPVTTCGGPAQAFKVVPNPFTIGIPFSVGDRTIIAPYVIPFALNFTYQFPANFGTWAVDNLSAPSGPGGGWAFDYLGPCT